MRLRSFRSLSVRARIELAQLIPLVPLTALGVGAALALFALTRVVEETRSEGLQRLNALAEATELFREEAALSSRYRETGDPAYAEAARARSDAVAGALAAAIAAEGEGGEGRLAVLLLDYERLSGLRGPAGDPREADRAARQVLAALKSEYGGLREKLRQRLVAAEDLGRTMAVGLLAAGGLLVVASVAATLVVSRDVVRDLAALEQATAALSAGDFGYRVEVARDDELGRLAAAMNRLSARIGELDRMKGDFFADISHDLKTPLTSILEASSLLAEGVAGPLSEDQRRLVGVMADSAERLHALVQNVLDLNRLGARNAELRPGDVGAAIDAVFHELRGRAERAELSLERLGLVQPPQALVNRGMIEQVLLNLLSNAIAFSPRGGRVTVWVEPAPPEALGRAAARGLRVRVEDQGPGVPEGLRERVFERYFRAPGAPKGGTGLGLAICRAIVESHGGRIALEAAPGGGASVWFTLAVADDPDRAGGPAPV